MKKPQLIEKFADNGEHSHWELADALTGIVLWSEEQVIVVCDNCKGELENKNGYIMCRNDKCGTVYEQV